MIHLAAHRFTRCGWCFADSRVTFQSRFAACFNFLMASVQRHELLSGESSK